ELMRAVWADTFVEDGNLSVAISHLRKALSKNGEQSDYIETIPRVGYRFNADVTRVDDESPSLIVEKRTVSRTVVEENMIPDGSPISAAQLSGAEATALLDIKQAPRLLGILPFTRRQTVIAAAVIAVGIASTLIWRVVNKRALPATSGQVKSMAVLPFKTLRSDSEDAYLGLGLADALITQLGRMREVAIRPLTAVKQYEALEHDPLAGRALGVEAVLEGTVQRDGDNIRVTIRLLRVEDGVVLWSGKFDEKFTDTFAMQDSISQQVAAASVLSVSKEQRELLAKRYTRNVDAYHLYLKGRYFWNKRTAEGLQRSLDYFQQAIEIDPTFALAYAGLADAYALGAWQDSLPQKIYIPRAKALAIKALEIDETVGEAHASLGFVR
ncbi:MAG: winged helix-turn-helix domain-containing protein, partial [Pyrinomonadaceae bacterium]